MTLARERYDNGYSDYLDVLDTERSLFSAQLSLAAARGDSYRALVEPVSRDGRRLGRQMPTALSVAARDPRTASGTTAVTAPHGTSRAKSSRERAVARGRASARANSAPDACGRAGAGCTDGPAEPAERAAPPPSPPTRLARSC